MTAEVIDIGCVTRLDIDPDRVLSKAIEAEMTAVIIVGFDADGQDYFAASMADAAEALWHLERAKWRLMRQADALQGADE